MYTTGSKDEHREETLAEVRAAMRSRREKSQAKRLAGLALSDQQSQRDARTRWLRRFAGTTPLGNNL